MTEPIEINELLLLLNDSRNSAIDQQTDCEPMIIDHFMRHFFDATKSQKPHDDGV
jgi:hypothetical protein